MKKVNIVVVAAGLLFLAATVSYHLLKDRDNRYDQASVEPTGGKKPLRLVYETPKLEPAKQVVVPDAEIVATAAEQVQIDNLIFLLRTAAVKKDSATQTAATNGLMRYGDAARTSVRKQIEQETNPLALDVLKDALVRIAR